MSARRMADALRTILKRVADPMAHFSRWSEGDTFSIDEVAAFLKPIQEAARDGLHGRSEVAEVADEPDPLDDFSSLPVRRVGPVIEALIVIVADRQGHPGLLMLLNDGSADEATGVLMTPDAAAGILRGAAAVLGGQAPVMRIAPQQEIPGIKTNVFEKGVELARKSQSRIVGADGRPLPKKELS